MSAQSVFLDSITPPILSGSTLQIKPTQTYSSKDAALLPDDSGSAPPVVHIAVSGPQIALDDTEVDSMYPSPGSNDSPPDYLPHIVLNRRTLPWERNGPATNVWLALLLVTDAELKSGLAQEVSTIPAAVGSDPFLATSLGGISQFDLAKPYQFLSMPRSFFAAICPTQAEMPLLCTVKRTSGPDGSGVVDKALLIGNRLPSGMTPQLHTAYLVSLENRADAFLPPGLPQTAGQVVTVPVLHKWSFTASGSRDFEQAIRSIAYRPAGGGVLRFGNLPQDLPAGSGDPLGAGFVSLLDEHGFFQKPLDHVQPGNAQFRGPLRPFAAPPRSTGFAVDSAPDELTGLPAANLADYSYAAAFELGRMIALSSKDTLEDLRDISSGYIVQKPNEVIPTEDLPALLRVKWLVDPEEVIVDPMVFLADPGDPASKAAPVLKSEQQFRAMGPPADITGVASLMDKAAQAGQLLSGTTLQTALTGLINLSTVTSGDLVSRFTEVATQLQVQVVQP